MSTVRHDWLVAQLGAREHYAVPRALARAGQLHRFFTDAWCRWGRSFLQGGPALARAFANRYHEDLSDVAVTSFNGMAVRNVLRRRLKHRDAAARLAQHHAGVGRRFAQSVTSFLQDRDLSSDRHAFLGFAVGSLEVIQHLNERGLFTVVDQISPGPVERRIITEEARRWPDWVDEIPKAHPVLEDRVAREWELADRILVNSEWSRTALEHEGVPKDKMIVVPGAFDPPVTPPPPNSYSTDRPFRVLWLGNVVLRKGIQYLIEAAQRLRCVNIVFEIVGPIGITDYALRQAPPNVTFHGSVARDQTSNFYRWADIFVFPTLSDGFGLTQLEAMAYGCPVITTPNCGRVVKDGVTGRIIAPRDSDALADAIQQMRTKPDWTYYMSRQAQSEVARYSVDGYRRRFLEAVRSPSL